MTYDVAIIGAGIVGSCIARELSKYKLAVCMVEKADDVSAELQRQTQELFMRVTTLFREL